MGYCSGIEEFRELLLEVLTPELESAVTRELIRDNEMLASRDGGEILPDTATLVTYIHREVQSASVMDRRKFWRGMESSKSTNQPIQKQTQFSQDQINRSYDQKFEEMNKKFASFSSKKPSRPPAPHHNPQQTQKSSSPYAGQAMRCYYCFQLGHGVNSCKTY